jgi:UDP-N-acetylmuramyl tripeptide synthase
MKLELSDSRRLTGANLYWDRPSAVIDVAIDGPPEPVAEAWEAAARDLLDAVGHAEEQCCRHYFQGGASLLISSPIDVMYSMCELNEAAWAAALGALSAGPAPDPEEVIPRLNRLFDEERNPALLALQSAARREHVPFLWDDDEVSIGYGRTCLRWSHDELPRPDEIDWGGVSGIPLALVTGTNGKSTTVRMTASIMSAAGFNAGLTSTDFIRVGDRLIDRGDYSGTGGARTLLRQHDVEMAVLEVARGGLLRRGLGVDHADVAVVTNVAADHLGEYGINTVPELIPAKFIVRRALGAGDTLVLNADDEGVLAYGRTLDNRISWFSLDGGHPQLRRTLAAGGSVAYCEDGWLIAAGKDGSRRIVRLDEIPAAIGGVMRHNVANALAAMSIAIALGIEDTAIRAGLSAFLGDDSDNPGRGNWFERNGVRILVDFAHNEHGMKAVAEAVGRVPCERVVLLMGQAGDRLDKDIADLVRAASAMAPDRLLVAELPGYERGREPFEVPELIRDEAVAAGVPAEHIEIFPGPAEATADALHQARPGDMIVLLALTQRTEALALVHEFVDGSGD